MRKGIIVEKIDNRKFIVEESINGRVQFEMFISGKIRLEFLRLNTGDTVYFELSPLDAKKARYVKIVQTE